MVLLKLYPILYHKSREMFNTNIAICGKYCFILLNSFSHFSAVAAGSS